MYQKCIYGFLFALSTAASAAIVQSDTPQTSRFRVTNQCDKTIWIQQDWKHPSDDPVVVKILPGMSYDYSIPEKGLASTRFWPKSGCNANGYDCTVGESTGVPDAERQNFQHGPYAPDVNSKFEATWGCIKSIYDYNHALCAPNSSAPGQYLNDETWWNGSAVDGFTLPYAIKVNNHQSSCKDLRTNQIISDPGVDCGGLTPEVCPTNANLSSEGQYNTINKIDVTQVNLLWKDEKTNSIAGCFSPCSKLTTAQGSDNGKTGGGWKTILGGLIPQSDAAKWYCCPTPPISPEECMAGPAARSSYAKAVHESKCNAYTYAYDDAKGLARCGSQTQFEVVFCPKAVTPPPPPPPTLSVDMKILIPASGQVLVDNKVISNNQLAKIIDGSILAFKYGTNITSCTVKLTQNKLVQSASGTLCAQLIINNTTKTITFPKTSPTDVTIQFNLNTSVGISAYINDVIVVNAKPMSITNFPASSVLKAYQAKKEGTCALTIGSSSVSKGSGEFCTRLNIVKEGSNIHIYLPADIPQMSSNPPPAPPPVQPKNIVFSMDSSIRANFKDQAITNGSKIDLSSLGDTGQFNLIAYQNDKSASCMIAKSGQTLTIVPNSGLLCPELVLITEQQGDYLIGIPNPLPDAGNNISFGLGIAQGMRVELNGQIIRWDSPNKTIFLPQGLTPIKIYGNNGTVYTCPVTRVGDKLTWPNIRDCQGVVHVGVLYFPAF